MPQAKTIAEAVAELMELLPQRAKARELSRFKVEGILYRAYQAAWNNGFDEAMELLAPAKGKGQGKEPSHD